MKLEESSHLWFVTFVTHNTRVSERMVTYGVKMGSPIIFNLQQRQLIGNLLTKAFEKYGVHAICWHALPDHVHMVVEANDEKDLNDKVRKIKGFTSKQFKEKLGWEQGQLWALKFNRKPIEDDNALRNIVNYVVNNHLKHADQWEISEDEVVSGLEGEAWG